MHSSQQNMNQYFLHQPFTAYNPMMNFPTNNQQLGQIQNYGVPNLFFGYPNAFSQQIMYPNQFIPSQSVQQNYQNANLISENSSLANIEKLLLETIPDLDGSEGSFEIKKFFKKFDAYLEDWPEKKKIFALKSKLDGKAKSFFILAIKSKRYNYKSIKNFILCQLLPSEYKVEESIDLAKKRTNSSQQKKNLKTPEKSHKPEKIPTPSFINKVNIQFEKEEFSKEILEFFEKPIDQDSAKDESEIENLEKGKFSENLVPMVEKEFKFELLKDLGKDQFCELDVELKCSLDGEQDFASVEFPIPTEIHVFQEIVPLDIPVSHEESVCSEEKECEESEELQVIREEGGEEYVDLEEKEGEECLELKEKGSEVCVDLKEKESEECFDLKEIDEYRDDLEIILEEKECDNLKVIGEGSDYCYGLEAEENVDEKGILEFKLDVFEKDPEKEILPTRDKLNILEEIKKKRNVLRSKMKEAKIMRMLRFEIPRNDFGKDFECGFLKRKITGRFFLGVRRCLNFEKLVTLIRVPKRSKNFLKETDRQMLDVKPMKVLQIVSVTKQDVIQVPKDVEIEKDWKKRKRKQEKGLVESVSVTEFLTIGVRLENFHRRSGSLNRVGLENPMITLTLTSPKSKERSTSPPKTFRGKQAEIEELILTSRTPSSEASGM
uniref:Uncharacterized protein n=2 Tax=Meloidogyne TaxID=189290 RepID=A0A6V7X2W3_MELEN|nr:unnamed protein product [Meloidogyne enterolobii]